jgi:hypothetical protein
VANAGCAVAVLPDGGVGTSTCDPLPPVQPAPLVCIPPYSNLGFGIGYDSAGNAVYNQGTGTGVPKGGVAGSAGGATGGATGPTAPSGAGGSGTTGESATNTNSSDSKDSGGCQMGAGRSSAGGASLLGLVGLLGLSRRRKTRAS